MAVSEEELRLRRTYTMHPKVIKMLEQLAEENLTNKSRVLEVLVRREYAKRGTKDANVDWR